MSDSINIEELEKQAGEISSLIRESENFLADPLLKTLLTESIWSRIFSAFIPTTVYVPPMSVLELALIFTLKGLERRRVRNNLVAYYKELVVKQNQIADAQQALLEEKIKAMSQLEAQQGEAEKKITELEKKLEAVNGLLVRIRAVQSKVQNNPAG